MKSAWRAGARPLAAPAAPGFADPVHDAQRSFRAVLAALAHPGRIMALDALAHAPVDTHLAGGAAAAVLLTLADAETPIWWQRPHPGTLAWVGFHTGAPQAATPAAAQLAVLDDAASMPPLSTFDLGTDEVPERSATLIIEVAALHGGPPRRWHGPGIQGETPVAVALPAPWWAQWQAQRVLFPRGVDVLLVSGQRLIGLPRTTRSDEAEVPCTSR